MLKKCVTYGDLRDKVDGHQKETDWIIVFQDDPMFADLNVQPESADETDRAMAALGHSRYDFNDLTELDGQDEDRAETAQFEMDGHNTW